MTFVNITIKGLDAEKYRKIKGIAAEQNANIGEVVNEALTAFIEFKKSKWKKIDPNDLLFTGEGRMDCGIDTDVRNADRYIYQ